MELELKVVVSACMVFVLLVVTILVIRYIETCKRSSKETVKIQDPDTGKETEEEFTVQNNPNEPEWVKKEVARRLLSLAQKGDKLIIECFNRKYPDPFTADRLARRWKNIRKNNALRETAFGEKSAAYTVNKGDELRICIRDSDKDEEFEDENTSMFVLLHEMAHLSSKSWGHGKEFRENFAKLVKAAVEIGVYKYQDFRNDSEDYCGTEITNPAYVENFRNSRHR
jgi:hypothetical protein